MNLPITRVVVHPDGAIVTRSGSLALVEHQAEVRGLPLLLDARTLRVRLPGLLSAELDLDLAGLDRAEDTEAAKELRQATLALELHDTELSALQAQRQALLTLAPSDDPEDEHIPCPSAAQLLRWHALEQALDPWALELDQRILGLHAARRELVERVALAEDAMRRASSQRYWARWAPQHVLHLRSQAEGRVEVSLSYRIAGATWSPAYVLDTDGLFRAGRFQARALIAQHTGEDWSNVALSVSSAPSARRLTLPRLASKRLGVAQPPRPSPWRRLPDDLDSLFPAPPPAPQIEDEPAPAAVSAPQSAPPASPAPRSPKRRRMAKRRPAPSPRSPHMDAELAATALDEPADSDAPGGRPFVSSPSPMAGPMATQATAAPPAPPALRVPQHALDYARLRMQPPDHPQRGRLQAEHSAQRLRQAGLPPAAVQAYTQAVAARRAQLQAVPTQAPPLHHVVPGPIQGGFVRFDAGDAVDLPSDGLRRPVLVLDLPIELAVRYRTAPQRDPRAFRQLRASLSHSGPLLAGPVEVFIDGSLALSRPWEGSPGGGRLLLGVGPEDGIKVVRNVRHSEQSAGMFGGSRRLLTEIEVELANSLGREVEVEVLSRVPLGDDDDVGVALTGSEPTAVDWVGTEDGPLLKGGKAQRVRVPAGGRYVAKLGYAITLSSKSTLVGGERRD